MADAIQVREQGELRVVGPLLGENPEDTRASQSLMPEPVREMEFSVNPANTEDHVALVHNAAATMPLLVLGVGGAMILRRVLSCGVKKVSLRSGLQRRPSWGLPARSFGDSLRSLPLSSPADPHGGPRRFPATLLRETFFTPQR